MQLARFMLASLGWGRFILIVVCLLGAGQVEAVNVNQATVQQLQQVKGIGPKTAERIIEERERAGPYRSLQDLSDRIKGIGPKRLLGLKEAGLSLESSTEKNTKK